MVGVWEGILEDVKVCLFQPKAESAAKAIKKKYDSVADKWDDEPEDNMNYIVQIKEVEVDAET